VISLEPYRSQITLSNMTQPIDHISNRREIFPLACLWRSSHRSGGSYYRVLHRSFSVVFLCAVTSLCFCALPRSANFRVPSHTELSPWVKRSMFSGLISPCPGDGHTTYLRQSRRAELLRTFPLEQTVSFQPARIKYPYLKCIRRIAHNDRSCRMCSV
jgi:hypothetical protein